MGRQYGHLLAEKMEACITIRDVTDLGVVVFDPDGPDDSVASIDLCGSFLYQTAMTDDRYFEAARAGAGLIRIGAT